MNALMENLNHLRVRVIGENDGPPELIHSSNHCRRMVFKQLSYVLGYSANVVNRSHCLG